MKKLLAKLYFKGLNKVNFDNRGENVTAIGWSIPKFLLSVVKGNEIKIEDKTRHFTTYEPKIGSHVASKRKDGKLIVEMTSGVKSSRLSDSGEKEYEVELKYFEFCL